MSLDEQENNYWINFWTNNPILENEDPQCQVGRTIGKIPIDQQQWQLTLKEVEKTLDLRPDDTLLDLCAGNGLLSIPLSLKCRSVTAVDISKTMLERIDTALYPNINIMIGDARKIQLPTEAFSKGLIYFALQFFSERETIGIFEKIFQSLVQGGTFLVGDILDIDRLFVYHNKPVWKKAYFDSVKNNAPAVGTWFKAEVLAEMAKYVGFSYAEIIGQRPDLINSHYRFDLLLKK
jgi:ubiquinone/menaquinone biosynthesis C-methylase UbiE